MTQRKLKLLPPILCTVFSVSITAQAMAQPVLGSLLGGGSSNGSSMSAEGESSGGSDDSPLAQGMEGGEQEQSSEQESSDDSPLAGLQENGGDGNSAGDSESGAGEGESGDDNEQSSPLVFENRETTTDDGSSRHDGLLLFPNNPDENGDQGDPTLFTHYTFSESLQSVRTCFAAGGECALQASLVFRDGEIERVRLFDEYIVGEPVEERDSSEHDPSH